MLKQAPVAAALHPLVANAGVTLVILGFVALTFSGELRRIEHAAHATVSLKIGIIAGLLVALALWWWAGSKPVEAHASRDEVVRALKRALDEAGIEIPFPYRTLTFKEPLALSRSKPRDQDNQP